MAVKIGSLFFDMRVGLAAWQRDMGRASKRLSRFGRQIGNVTRKMSIFGGAVSGVGLVLLGDRVIEAADQVDKLSKRLGASTEALSQYRHVAQLTGVQFTTLTMAWQRMVRRVAEAAEGMGEARGALKELGLEAAALNRLAPEQQFEVIADALGSVENQADRVRLAFKLFDSEGVAVLQTMEGGSEAMKAMREEADRLGKTLTREQVDKLVAAKDAWTRFRAAIEGIVQTLVVELGPALAAIGEWLAEILPNALQEAKLAWIRVFQEALFWVAKVTTWLGKLNTALIPLTSGGLQEKHREWAASMFEVAGAALEMADSLEKGITLNMALVGRFDETLKRHATTWENLNDAQQAAAEAVVQYPEAAKKVDVVTAATDSLGRSLKDVAQQGIRGQLKDWDSLKQVAVSALQDILAHVLQLNSAMSSGGASGGGFAGILGAVTGLFAGGAGSAGAGAEFASLPVVPLQHGAAGLRIGGSGGPDSQRFIVEATPGEVLTATPPNALRRGQAGGGQVFNVDLRGASIEAVARLEQFVARVNGSIERRAVAAVFDSSQRGGRIGGALGTG